MPLTELSTSLDLLHTSVVSLEGEAPPALSGTESPKHLPHVQTEVMIREQFVTVNCIGIQLGDADKITCHGPLILFDVFMRQDPASGQVDSSHQVKEIPQASLLAASYVIRGPEMYEGRH